MFSDTLVFTDLHGTTDYTLIRINQDGYSSEYLLKASDREFRLTIKNVTYQDKKRNVLIDRHTCQLTETIYPVAPAILSTVRKSYTVFEIQQGDTIASAVEVAIGLAGFLSASSGANMTKMANFES
ncbi:TPA_asm: coat protein [ssRNA phage Zoerhiza.4_24]|uniref:Coat protein n=2 Tax=Leviviricetes TaxID=2842243 RepID=A0A8S5KZ33_9VIRU|nr:coat protein [ssRNA phage Zoerhiza.4_24]QDH89965.1 MAG: hypothetical protein H4Rhizo45414_000002 [Leviviridae sp.]DAD50431.1 TPA_asm: coat protein [ssRNA phage Zoerhiza.4_24]